MPRVLTSSRSSTPGRSSPRTGHRRGNDGTGFFGARTSETGGARSLAVEIAKQEAVTVKPGNPTGANQYSRGDGGNVRNTDNSNTPRDKESVTGLLRRLAKQGRDDLLDRVASGELRKDFTPTERVAIAKAIEEEIGNRQGKRTDLELPVDRPEVPGNETRAIAAGKAGFGSEVAVVENHTPKSGMTFAVELNSVR
jgi:hypothetical protein